MRRHRSSSVMSTSLTGFNCASRLTTDQGYMTATFNDDKSGVVSDIVSESIETTTSLKHDSDNNISDMLSISRSLP